MTTDSLRKQVVEAMAQVLLANRIGAVTRVETATLRDWHEHPLFDEVMAEAEAALDAALEVLGEQVADWHEAADLLNGDSDCDSLPADLLAVLRAGKGSDE